MASLTLLEIVSKDLRSWLTSLWSTHFGCPKWLWILVNHQATKLTPYVGWPSKMGLSCLIVAGSGPTAFGTTPPTMEITEFNTKRPVGENWLLAIFPSLLFPSKTSRRKAKCQALWFQSRRSYELHRFFKVRRLFGLSADSLLRSFAHFRQSY